MTSTGRTTVENSGGRTRGSSSAGFCSGGGNWSGINIAIMVVSFVFFWPVGLLVLYWILKGRDARDLPAAIREKVQGATGLWGNKHSYSGNAVFNEFQQTQYDRIREIKDEIKERSNRFKDFRSDAKRRADEEEFNRFMSSSPSSES